MVVDLIRDAKPAEHFNHPPFRAELFSAVSGFAGVINRNNVNCLTFRSRPGSTVTTIDTATAIADAWNNPTRVSKYRRVIYYKKTPQRSCFKYGGVAEWSIAPVLKTGEPFGAP
jgi:hypothetical protein